MVTPDRVRPPGTRAEGPGWRRKGWFGREPGETVLASITCVWLHGPVPEASVRYAPSEACSRRLLMQCHDAGDVPPAEKVLR